MFNPYKVQNLGVLYSNRLKLEPLRAHHSADLFPGFNDPGLYEWISTPQPQTAQALADSWTCSGDNGPFFYNNNFGLDWAAIRMDGNQAIGKLDADFDVNGRVVNLGYVLRQDAWGHGLGREAVGALVGAFVACGVTEIYAYVTKGNVASERLLNGLGFHRQRVIPDNDLIKGQLFDDIEFVFRAHHGG
jgi:[ribosomal protein S5]-alanine N-acetyltransferase